MINLISNILSVLYFAIGLFFGYKLSKNKQMPSERKETDKKEKQPKLSKKEKEQIEKQQQYYESIMNNINNYDGSAMSQKEIKEN